nr:uncharacterized protein LOC105334187 [Crassostrea gigas]
MRKQRQVFFLILCVINASWGLLRVYKRSNENLSSLDHSKLFGRWYLFMDNRNSTVRDNTFGDFELTGDGKLLNHLYRYFPNTQECRSTSLLFQPLSSDPSPEHAVEFEVIRMSNKEVLGTQTYLYINDDKERGFVIMHQESNQMNTYLVVTRSKTPSGQQQAINNALINLNLDQNELRVKSTDYGCETNTERGFEF